MAETGTKTGVRSGESTKGGSAKSKKQRLMLIGGAGLIGVLFLAEKGNSNSGGNNSSGLNNDGEDAYTAGAYDSGYNAGSNLATGPKGSTGPRGKTGKTGTVNKKTVASDVKKDLAGDEKKKKSPPKKKKPVHKKPVKKKTVNDHPPKAKDKDKAGKPAPVKKSVAHTPKPAPAKKDGTHPETTKVSSRGKAKNSPVVEMPLANSSGVVVMGRQFSGATGHRMGPPRRAGNGQVVRDVTIFFGGRSEVHTCGPNGNWSDYTRGRNPLASRPVPQRVRA